MVSTSTNQDVATIDATGNPSGVRGAALDDMAISADGTTGYATLGGFGEVVLFSTATNQTTGTIPVGSSPVGIALDGGYGYVANYNDGTVSVINTATNRVATTVPVGSRPFFIAVIGPPVPIRPSAHSCTVTDTSDDPGDSGSLRYCVNTVISGGTISFASSLNGQTITLSAANGPIRINAGLTIQGPGANLLAVSGGAATQVFTIGAGSTVAISGLTIQNGTGAQGGGIYNSGMLTLDHVTVSGNIATGISGSYADGAGIYNGATLTISNSTVSNNIANPNGYGSCGGGIFNVGTLTVINSTVANNFASVTGTGGYGGGICNGDVMTVTNSTVTANFATFAGGAVYNDGTATVDFSTIFGNTSVQYGSGVFNDIGSTVTLQSNLLASNARGGNCDQFGGVIISGGYNVSDDVSCPLSVGDLNNIAADLDPDGLQNNGGPTQTILPLPGSPAICSGAASVVPLGVVTDQRGFPRLNTSYAGYASHPCVDAGAVQTNYESVQFDRASYGAKVGQLVSPSPMVSVIENGQILAGIPVTLAFGGSGAVSGVGPVSTVAGVGATFDALSVNMAGSDSLSATLPVVGAFTLSANASLTITPVQTTPTVTWASPAAMTYRTPLGATQLDATASVPGTFAYSPAAGTILAPGTSTLSVTFTPTDLTDYTTATASVSISVEYGVCLLYDQTKSVHSGAAYPVKLYLCDASGADVSAASIVLHATSIVGVSSSSGDVEDTGNANPDADFRFDSTLGPSGGYIFNLSTNGVPSGTYALQFTVGTDPTLHSATFGVK